MFTWCAILFGLGVLAFLDSLFNMGDIFRRVNSVMFLLISLGLLIRTTIKIKTNKQELLEKKVFNLEQQVRIMEQGEKKLAEF